MKVNVSLPFDRIDPPEEFITREALIEIATVIDNSRFYGCNVSDHPCPTARWLDSGGHYAQDPFAMLSLLGGITERIRLQTGILVLPYRNPFVTARSVATLDVYTNGRVILGVGAGYLKGEYRAMGVDFDKRNQLMDEYIRALKTAWCNDEFSFEGDGYRAFGNRILPRPIQKPHPPILIGGNSRMAIRRAAELGDAWNPFFNANAAASTTRTASIDGVDDLVEGIKYLHDHCDKIGRETPPEIITASLTSVGEAWNPEAVREKIGRMKEAGISGCAAHIEGMTRHEWCENAQRFDEEILARID